MGLEIGFIKQFDCEASYAEGVFAGLVFDFAELDSDGWEIGNLASDELFGALEIFRVGGGRLVDGIGFLEEEDLGARADRGEQRAGMFGEQDEVAVGVGLFESFEKSVLSSLVHGIGRSDNKETIAGFTVIREAEKLAELVDANGGSFFAGVGL